MNHYRRVTLYKSKAIIKLLPLQSFEIHNYINKHIRN
jgi:hypothetical protein